MFATILIAAVVIGFGLLLIHVFPVEKGTPTGATAPAADQHSISGWGWVVVVVFAVVCMGIASHPRTYPFFKAAWETLGHAGASASVSVSAGGSSAQAQATVVSLVPSKDGIKLMDQHFGKIAQDGRKLKSFENLGDGWYWCVVDPSVSPTAGQDVVGGVYEVTDPSVTSVTVFCARKVNGVYEFGDRRTFPLR
ncbi:hypothetical protein COU79_05575 [Candidatus Peregrinibacteria bacterium CG10_big_fil_rev_8_21_14_0_10_54_7]|nr:MAG: hypothetical protein COU79_05575 [Candidatus Peregrinibacteria bacterium CG10_big_fil_rev_8_21_14_0_10_54_7]